jgi:hypothetical protein
MKLLNLLNEIERSDMPQIKGKDIPDALNILAKNGIAYRKGSVAVGLLKPTQDDANKEKMDSISTDIENGKQLPPIFISKDGSIIDGHHRWLAYKNVYGDGYKMSVVQIMLPKIQCLKLFIAVSEKV